MAIKIIEFLNGTKIRAADRALFTELKRMVETQYPFPKLQVSKKKLSLLLKKHFPAKYRENPEAVFLALQNGKPIAKVTARLADHADKYQEKTGILSSFESLDVMPPVKALFDSVMNWFRDYGVTTVIGPVSEKGEYRDRLMCLGPFKKPPFFLEPCQPTYYSELWENYGFWTQEDYFSRHLERLEILSLKLKPYHQKMVQKGYRFETISGRKIQKVLEDIQGIAESISLSSPYWNGGDDINDLLQVIKDYSNKKLIHVAYSQNDDPVGFSLAIPNQFPALSKKKDNVLNLLSFAVLPEYQCQGIGSSLCYKTYQTALQQGFTSANLCLVSEGNFADRIHKAAGSVFRRYRLYAYSL